MSCPPSATHGGVLLQDLLKVCKISHLLSHRCLCPCLWVLPSVLSWATTGLSGLRGVAQHTYTAIPTSWSLHFYQNTISTSPCLCYYLSFSLKLHLFTFQKDFFLLLCLLPTMVLPFWHLSFNWWFLTTHTRCSSWCPSPAGSPTFLIPSHWQSKYLKKQWPVAPTSHNIDL